MLPSCSLSSAEVFVSLDRKESSKGGGIDLWPVYIFIGGVLIENFWYKYLPGGIVAFVGIAYIVLEFVPNIEPPANMRYVMLNDDVR